MWKHGDGGDEYPGSGDYYDGSGGHHEGDKNDHMGDHNGDHMDDHGMMGGLLDGVLGYLNSEEFCDIFHLVPPEWSPDIMVAQCLANYKTYDIYKITFFSKKKF